MCALDEGGHGGEALVTLVDFARDYTKDKTTFAEIYFQASNSGRLLQQLTQLVSGLGIEVKIEDYTISRIKHRSQYLTEASRQLPTVTTLYRRQRKGRRLP